MSKPASARLCAIASPMPRLAPVTRATGRLMPQDPSLRMWSATRSACAAIDSAGLTAAEFGRKPPSTTNRLRWSKARHHGSSGAAGRIVAHAHGAALMRRRALVERARQHDRIAAGAQILAHHLGEPGQRLHVGAPPLHHDAGAVDHDAALGVRQVLAHQVPVDGMARHVVEREFRRELDVGSQNVAVDLAEQLHIAERLAALAVGQIVVVEAERLLVDGIVDPARVDRQHRRAVVVHEIAADLVGGIGKPARRRSQQDGRRIDGAGAEDDELRRQRLRFAVLAIVDRRRSSCRRAKPPAARPSRR